MCYDCRVCHGGFKAKDVYTIRSPSGSIQWVCRKCFRLARVAWKSAKQKKGK
jgi:hypothetical protein